MAEAGGAGGGWSNARSAAGNRSPWLIAGVVSLATFMEVLDISIANVSLDHIAGELSASYDETTWVLTSYLIANAIAVPISGWLSKVVGRKRFYMACVALFTVSSLFCGLAPSLPLLIIARVFQGIGGGGLAPSEQSILTETFPPAKRGGAFAIYGLTVITAPILGPTLGGFITDQTSWHWIFFLNVPVGLLSLFLVHTFVVDPPLLEEERKKRLSGGLKVDVLGILFLVAWLGCQEYALDRGQRLDWLQSGSIRLAAIVAALSAIGLFVWEWRSKDPVFDVRLLFRRSYFLSILAMLTTGAVLLSTTQMIPQFLQQALGYTASDAGLAMTFGGLVTIVMMPIAGIAVTRVQPKYLMMGALASEVIALFLFTRLSSEVNWWWAAFARMGLAFGLPFLFLPISTSAYADVPPEKIPEASSQINLARNLGGSIAISIAQAVFEQRSQFHQARLVETVAPGTTNDATWTFQAGRAFASQGASAAQAATAQLYQVIQKQAEVLAYVDVFWVLTIGVAIVTPLLIFLKKVPLGAGASAH